MTTRVVLTLVIAALSGPVRVAAQDDPSAALAEFLVPTEVRRYALVFGAERYPKLKDQDGHPLEAVNALNDAKRIAEELRTLQFSSVRHVPHATRNDISTFTNELALTVGSEPAIVVFFFAGHGFQVGTGNFLVPNDASENDLVLGSMSLKNVLGTIVSDRHGLTIVFLDACRTEMVPNGVRSTGFSSVGRTRGAILSFASEFDKPAKSVAKAGQQNSPYTLALLKYIQAPDVSLATLLEGVQGEVENETRHLRTEIQSPTFVVGAGVATTGFAFKPGRPQREMERRHWEDALKSYDPSCIQRYVANHPGSLYLSSAARWLAGPPLAPPTGRIPCWENAAGHSALPTL